MNSFHAFAGFAGGFFALLTGLMTLLTHLEQTLDDATDPDVDTSRSVRRGSDRARDGANARQPSVDKTAESLHKLERIYLDDHTNEPTWVTAKTAPFSALRLSRGNDIPFLSALTATNAPGCAPIRTYRRRSGMQGRGAQIHRRWVVQACRWRAQ